MKVAITGATGLVGSNLAAICCDNDFDVVCTKRNNSSTKHLRNYPVHWIEADLDNIPALTSAFNGADLVVHCAAIVSFWSPNDQAMYQTNVIGTENVIKACQQANVPRMVHCSSVDALGLPTGDSPADETTPWNWDTMGLDYGYPRTKRQAEEMVRKYVQQGLDAVIVNPTLMVGPLDPKPSSGRMLLQIASGTAKLAPGGNNNFVDVRDVCRGILLAAQKGRCGESYILGNENMSYREFFTLVAIQAGKQPPMGTIPKFLARSGGLFGDLWGWLRNKETDINSVTANMGYVNHVFNSAKARKELGYTTGNLNTAVQDALQWFSDEGYIR